MNKRSDFVGTEFDWFAVDSDGFVALMSSAGYGRIPDCVFDRFDEQQQQIGRFLAHRIRQPLMNAWDRMLLSLSAAGVFAYDWEHWNGPYRRLVTPSVPQHIDHLGIPAELREAFAVLPACTNSSNPSVSHAATSICSSSRAALRFHACCPRGGR